MGGQLVKGVPVNLRSNGFGDEALDPANFTNYFERKGFIPSAYINHTDRSIFMERQRGLPFMMLFSLFLLASCAAQFPFLASATLSEATELKVLCGQEKLDAVEIRIADSLYQQGTVLAKAGKRETAYALLDRAIVHYRIALTKSTIAKKEKEIAKQEQALAKTYEDVSAYQQVLKELKTMERQ